jgi:hypothetical protein
VPIYAWACTSFGLAGAAIIGLLEFLDRAEELPEQPLASRARIIADLQGLVGRNAVDAALDELVKSKAVSRHIEVQPGKNNIKRLVRYGLDLPGLEQLLGTPEIGNSRNSRNRESPEFPESVPKSGVPSYIEELEEEAAPRAHARGTDSAAASKGSNAKRQHPDRSRLGIECWYPSEDQEADAIVAAHDSDAITAAVTTIRQQLNGAGKRTSPVPALVLAELERQQRERDAAVRRAQEDAELRVRAISEIDPAAQAKGQQLLPATLRARLPKTTITKEATA